METQSPYCKPGIQESNINPSTKENIWKIIFTVCKHFGAWTNDPDYLKNKSRSPELGTPRMVVIVLFHYLLAWKQTEATDYFGMTPAGFWYSRKKINEWYLFDKSFKGKIDGIINEISQTEKQKEYLYRAILD